MRLISALILGVLASPVQAQTQLTEIYKCVDKTGRPLYTSDKRETAGMKCELVSKQVNVVPAQKIAPPASTSRGAAPSVFPRETPAERASAKGRQREILEQELAAEQRLLDKAKKDLVEQESVRSGDERNYARVEERLKPYQESVDLHQKNIEALRRELNANR